MKKIICLVVFAFLYLFVTSCVEPTNENEIVNTLPEKGTVVFHTSIVEPQTKTVLSGDEDEPSVSWQVGDKISVFYHGIQGEPFITQTGSSTNADFMGTLPEGGPVENDPYYYAIFGHRNSGTGGNNYITGTQPAFTTWLASGQSDARENNISPGAMLHAGRSMNLNMPMYNLCALFRFKITKDEDVRRVQIKGENGAILSASISFQFDESGKPTNIIPNANGTQRDYIDLSKANGAAFQKDTWYYISMLPQPSPINVTVTLYTTTSTATRDINNLQIARSHCLGASKLDGSLEYVDAVKARIRLNDVVVSKTTLWPKGTAALSASFIGPNNNNVITPDALSWSSSVPEVATVEDGLVTGLTAGITTITAKATIKGKEYNATCKVTVTTDNNLDARPFYVDPNNYVYFSPANLFTSDGGSSFEFNDYQGQIRHDSSNWSSDIPNERDLLMWTEVATRDFIAEEDTTMLYYPNINKPSDSFWSINWNTPRTFSIDNKTWHMLSYEQWVYLVEHNGGCAKATVNGVPGLVLLPNGFTNPDGITVVTGGNKPYTTNVFVGDIWKELEQCGVVFLPEAGNKNASGKNAGNGHYWSRSLKTTVEHPSSLTSLNGNRLNFSNTSLGTNGTLPQNWYVSVRLVRFE